jgi:hypothetical protein
VPYDLIEKSQQQTPSARGQLSSSILFRSGDDLASTILLFSVFAKEADNEVDPALIPA